MVLTPNPLRSATRLEAIGLPSKALATAVLSLDRLTFDRFVIEEPVGGEPASRAVEPTPNGTERLARRISGLALHLFADLNDLPHSRKEDRITRRPASASELDGDRRFDPTECEALESALSRLTSRRLGESPSRAARLRFIGRVATIRSGEILRAVRRARPWALPVRLRLLVPAALVAILLCGLGVETLSARLRLGTGSVVAVSALALAGTTALLVVRQGLVDGPGAARLGEQRVIAALSGVLVILGGLTLCQVGLFGLIVVLGLWAAPLLESWAPILRTQLEGAALPGTAGLAAAVGVLVGGGVASFQRRDAFWTAVYVDEEA
ncbi:MAG: hypothetical protein ACX98W_19985 [bacterium]